MNLLRINQSPGKDTYRFIDGGVRKGEFDVSKAENTVFLTFHVPLLKEDKKLSYLQYIDEQITRMHHPECICIKHGDPSDHVVLNGCGYYAKGKDFLKKVDPWRLKLNDRIFDDRGFIIDQGNMQEVPFGWFSTREKGCGWIAAWNLLRLNGIDQPIELTVKEISKHAFLGEALGANIFTLKRYLNQKGLPVKITLPADKDTLPKIEKSSSGILLYHHLRGAHYVAYEKEEDRLHFYNAVYGKRNHYESLEHFLKKYEFLPISMALYMEKK